jgi:predicted AlkP superfamily phosphohydrolase/phosphomutase
MEVAPQRIETLVQRHGRHPYSGDLPRTSDPNDALALARIGNIAAEGIRLRSELAQELIAETSPGFTLVVFPELHDAGHFLWHTADPDHPVFTGEVYSRRDVSPSLEDLYVATDTEIGNIRKAGGSDCSVAVMALHGMRSGVGWPTLASLLLERGDLLHPATWRSRTPRDNLIALFGALKKRAPKPVRDLYRRRAGTALQIRMARPTMIPDHDWKRTKAFPVMDDHAGFIRLNLAGREREGIVDRGSYNEIVEMVERAGRSLKTDTGADLVEEIVRPVGVEPERLELPDAVVHWTDEAFKARPPTINGVELPPPLFPGRTGRHEARGFCIADGEIAAVLADSVRTEDLHRALIHPLIS